MSLSAGNLRLFGAIELSYHSRPIDLTRARIDELLAYLALRRGEACSRSQVAYALWPDSSDKQARTDLRNLIFNLKKTWSTSERSISLNRSELCWRLDADVSVDIHHFEDLLTQEESVTAIEERTAILTEAASLYRGDLLPNCYEDWAMAARQRLREQQSRTVEQLIDGLLDLRRYDEALDWAKRLHSMDPLQESAYRKLMQSYMALGDRASALRTFQRSADMLQRELGVRPSSPTQQIYEQLLNQNVQKLRRPESAPASTVRPHLVGRRLAWQNLLDVWRQAESGQARLVLLQGEAGIGKTRLAEELIDWVERQGHAWAGSRSYAARGAIAYAPVATWLRAPSLRIDLAEIDDLWRVEIHRLLPEMAAERPDLPTPGPISEDWQRHRFYQAVVQTIRSCPAPLLLHLDDMQWTDPETLAFLHFLLQRLHDHPLLIVGSARVEGMAANEPLVRLIQDLRHNRYLESLSLGPLSAHEIHRLAEQTAGEQIDGETATSLYTTSEGHPLLLIETIRAHISQDDEAHNSPTNLMLSLTSNDIAIPNKIHSMMANRLEQLSLTARRLVEMAAVIGRDFTIELLREASEYEEVKLVEALDELWQHRIVRHQGDTAYDFSHDRLREVTYQHVSPPRVRLLHGRVARAMALIHAHELDVIAGQLGAHYEYAGERELACKHYAQAAAAATQRHALLSADDFYESALRLATPSDAVGQLKLLQGQAELFASIAKGVERWQSNLAAQEVIVQENDIPDSTYAIQVHLCHATYHLSLDQYADAVRAANVAIRLAEEVDNAGQLARAHLAAGEALWLQSRMSDAGPHFRQAIRNARLAEDRATEASAIENSAAIGMFSGAVPEELHTQLHEALSLAEGLGHRLIEASIHNKFGFQATVQGMGEWATAEQHFQHGLAIARETGERILERLISANMGVLHINMGDYRLACQHLKMANSLGTHGVFRMGYAQNYLARAYLHQGRLDDALPILTPAVKQLQISKHLHGEIRARSDLSFLMHLQGEHERAREELQSILHLIRQYGDTRQEALAYIRSGYVEEIRHQWNEAARAYEQGYQCHNMVGQHYHAMNGLAGLARVAQHRGEDATAYQHVSQVWETLQGQHVDATIETVRTFRTCHEIFSVHGDPLAAAVFDTAWNQLQSRVGSIDDPSHVSLFWQIPDHRYFLRLHENAAPNQ